MLRRITPAAICPPLANYSHAVEVPPNARWLYVSGQLGIAPDGTVPGSCAEQAEACFANLLAILAEGGMGAGDLVRLNTYLTDAADRAAYMAVRDRHVAAPPPASTLLVVRALARPEFKIEIEAIAAQAAEPGRYGLLDASAADEGP
jgi:enamine deaminase RidA (YjgF/YER057c/UK114 family)